MLYTHLIEIFRKCWDKDTDTENDSDTPETLEIEEETIEEEHLDWSGDSCMFLLTSITTKAGTSASCRGGSKTRATRMDLSFELFSYFDKRTLPRPPAYMRQDTRSAFGLRIIYLIAIQDFEHGTHQK